MVQSFGHSIWTFMSYKRHGFSTNNRESDGFFSTKHGCWLAGNWKYRKILLSGRMILNQGFQDPVREERIKILIELADDWQRTPSDIVQQIYRRKLKEIRSWNLSASRSSIRWSLETITSVLMIILRTKGMNVFSSASLNYFLKPRRGVLSWNLCRP